ncbi:MAG: hypothetical protein ABIO04_03075 [Ferruginibacter sp.]
MKQLINSVIYKPFLLIALLVVSTLSWAQDSAVSSSTTSTSTTTTERTWYAEPWVWIVGGVILLLIIIALTRGGGRTDRVTITKTRTD